MDGGEEGVVLANTDGAAPPRIPAFILRTIFTPANAEGLGGFGEFENSGSCRPGQRTAGAAKVFGQVLREACDWTGAVGGSEGNISVSSCTIACAPRGLLEVSWVDVRRIPGGWSKGLEEVVVQVELLVPCRELEGVMVGVSIAAVLGEGAMRAVYTCGCGAILSDHFSAQLVASDIKGDLGPTTAIGCHVTEHLERGDGSVRTVGINGVVSALFHPRSKQGFATGTIRANLVGRLTVVGLAVCILLARLAVAAVVDDTVTVVVLVVSTHFFGCGACAGSSGTLFAVGTSITARSTM